MWNVWRPDASAVVADKRAREGLKRYFDVIQDCRIAKFLIAKKLPAKFSGTDSLTNLWHTHDNLTERFYELQKEVDTGNIDFTALETPEKSYLDLKIKIASRVLEHCHFCTRRCGLNRLRGELGYCRCGTQITVSTIFEHIGEEPELVPSGTIFTFGCTLRCLHCQNWTISQWFEKGKIYTPKSLAKEVENLRKNGCRNINLVGGEPTPWLQQWLETFKHVRINVPIVWNSNTYYSEETAKLLAGFADVYLLDFKYGSDECAERISDAPNYWQVCCRNHLYAKKYGELIIRVLVLPGHLECCTKSILDWIAENLEKNVRVNVMFQYRPEWRANEIPELRKRLTTDEMKWAIEYAEKAGLRNSVT